MGPQTTPETENNCDRKQTRRVAGTSGGGSGQMTVDVERVRTQVKEIIGAVADLDPSEMADEATLVEGLGLDSLSLLEVSVDVDYHFKLGLAEGEMKGLATIQDIVDLVVNRLGGEAATG